MTQIEKVKAAIERLKREELLRTDIGAITGKHFVIDADVLLSSIESLEKEQEVDLRKKVDRWRHEHYKGARDGHFSGEYLTRESQLDLAEHFYDLGIKWQAEQRKEVGVMIHQGTPEQYGIVKLLTWEDIAKIITIYEEGIGSGEYKRYGDAKCVKKYSQDILRRFNELKAREKK